MGVEGQKVVVTHRKSTDRFPVQNMPPSFLKSPLRFLARTAGSSERQSSQKTSRSNAPVCPFFLVSAYETLGQLLTVVILRETHPGSDCRVSTPSWVSSQLSSQLKKCTLHYSPSTFKSCLCCSTAERLKTGDIVFLTLHFLIYKVVTSPTLAKACDV